MVANLFREERLRLIMEMIYEKKKVFVKELADKFGKSSSSIRLDLAELESRGLINRFWMRISSTLDSEEFWVSIQFESGDYSVSIFSSTSGATREVRSRLKGMTATFFSMRTVYMSVSGGMSSSFRIREWMRASSSSFPLRWT